jgi:hypothetical protein
MSRAQSASVDRYVLQGRCEPSNTNPLRMMRCRLRPRRAVNLNIVILGMEVPICRYEGSGPSQPSFGSATIGVKARARGIPASSPGEMRCGSVQDLRHPVVVDKHATDHQVLSLHYHEALAREQPPGELAGLGEQARYSLLAGRRLHGVIQP